MDLSDLDKIKLCAEAVLRLQGIGYGEADGKLWYGPYELEYDPLHDDAQAMALVKKFHLQCDFDGDWKVEYWAQDPEEGYSEAESTDLNRAIVECCARAQAARGA